MEIDYKTNKLKKQLSSASEIKKAFGVNAKRVSQRLEEIKAAPNLFVLMKLPAANCHALIGDRDGEWALNISGNHRIIFKITRTPAPTTKEGHIDALLVKEITILKAGIDYH